MDASSSSAAKMEQFLALGKALRGRALAELIATATSEPGLYAFGELLELPGMAEARRRLARARVRARAPPPTAPMASSHPPPTPTRRSRARRRRRRGGAHR